MEIQSNAKRVLLKSCFAILFFFVLLWFSAFLYGLLYYLYIPAVAHVKPIYLRYDVLCSEEKICRYPHDNITLVESGHYQLLRHGQAYAIEVILDMPESERNLNQGMFMIRLDMLGFDGTIVKSSSRPAMLRYRSPLFKAIYTLFYIPGLLIGTTEEKQDIIVPLFEKYVENSNKAAYFAYIEVQARVAEIYKSSLRIHAQFTGLRYFMYYWPVLSAIVGIMSNLFVFLMFILVIWIRYILRSDSSRAISEEIDQNVEDIASEIRERMREQQVVEPETLTGRRSEETVEEFDEPGELLMNIRKRVSYK